MCWDFLYKLRQSHFSILRRIDPEKKKMYTFLHVKYSVFLPIFCETRISYTNFWTTLKYKVFEQHSNMKFLNNTQI
jgi:hypothetical protein